MYAFSWRWWNEEKKEKSEVSSSVCNYLLVLGCRERAGSISFSGELQPSQAALGVCGSHAHGPLLLRPPADPQHALRHWRGCAGTQQCCGSPVSVRHAVIPAQSSRGTAARGGEGLDGTDEPRWEAGANMTFSSSWEGGWKGEGRVNLKGLNWMCFSGEHCVRKQPPPPKKHEK